MPEQHLLVRLVVSHLVASEWVDRPPSLQRHLLAHYCYWKIQHAHDSKLKITTERQRVEPRCPKEPDNEADECGVRHAMDEARQPMRVSHYQHLTVVCESTAIDHPFCLTRSAGR